MEALYWVDNVAMPTSIQLQIGI